MFSITGSRILIQFYGFTEFSFEAHQARLLNMDVISTLVTKSLGSKPLFMQADN
jgi:hypothetical protein